MIAIVLTMGKTSRVLLSEHPLPAATWSRLERAGYAVTCCLTPKRVRSEDELVEAVVPLLQRDLFAELSS